MSRSALSAVVTSFKNAGKALEHSALPFRSFVHPFHVWTYWNLVRHHPFQPDGAGHKFACFDFTNVKIDHISGRYVFSLVRDFESAGFQICYRKNFRFLATMRHKRFKRLLLDRPFQIYESLSEMPGGSTVVEVTDRIQPADNPGCQQVRISYDERWPRAGHEVPMTFFVHPLLHERWLACPAPDLDGLRPWRVFFSGRYLDAKYARSPISERFGKMSRLEIMQTLEAGLAADRLQRVETAADLAPGAVRGPCFVLSDAARYRIPPAEWLNVLGRADFFLACPGMRGLPLCHNLIEALSRGAAPILEHPEFLEPPLEHNVNCLVFRGPVELVKTFERAFQFDEEQARRLRQGAYAYYQRHLAPGQFAKRLVRLARPRVELLLNAYRTPRQSAPVNAIIS